VNRLQVGLLIAALWLACSGLAVLAQAPNHPAFEVASVKLRPGSVDATDIKISGSGIRVAGRTVRGLVVFAYESGLVRPGWTG